MAWFRILAQTACLLAPLLAPLPAAAAAGIQPVTLAPHRAVYDFVLAKSSAGASITDMNGRMVFELTGSACDGYSQAMRFVTRTTNQNGETSVADLRNSSWEEAMGRSFRFNSHQYRDDKLSETTTGEAQRGRDSVVVELTKPQRKKISIPASVLFPVQHSVAMLDAARRGQTVFQADLYDGAEKGEKYFMTMAAIGKEKPPGHNAGLASVPNGEALDALRSWPITLGYFDPKRDVSDALPTYELSFLFFENGVVRNVVLDYGDFVLRGDMKSLTFLEAPRCDRSKVK